MRKSLTLILVLLWCSAVFSQKAGHTKVFRSDYGISLMLDEGILEDQNVMRHLGSGLTTTFRFEVRLRAPGQPTKTKVLALALRYELWEENYILTIYDGEKVTINQKLAGKDALFGWWRSAALPLFDSWNGNPSTYRVEVEVIPFSAGERKAAAEWVNQSLSEGEPNGNSGGDLGAKILSTIVATSFKRRVLQTFTSRGEIP